MKNENDLATKAMEMAEKIFEQRVDGYSYPGPSEHMRQLLIRQAAVIIFPLLARAQKTEKLLEEFLTDWAGKLPGCRDENCRECKRREEFIERVKEAVKNPGEEQ